MLPRHSKVFDNKGFIRMQVIHFVGQFRDRRKGIELFKHDFLVFIRYEELLDTRTIPEIHGFCCIWQSFVERGFVIHIGSPYCQGNLFKSTFPPLRIKPTFKSLKSIFFSHSTPTATAADGSMTILARSHTNFIESMMTLSLTVTICSTRSQIIGNVNVPSEVSNPSAMVLGFNDGTIFPACMER